MRRITRATFITVSIVTLILTINSTPLAQTQIKDRFANVNGVKLQGTDAVWKLTPKAWANSSPGLEQPWVEITTISFQL